MDGNIEVPCSIERKRRNWILMTESDSSHPKMEAIYINEPESSISRKSTIEVAEPSSLKV